jgi:hypothetical protein
MRRSRNKKPVETTVLEPPERSLSGGDLLVKIGEEVSEYFNYRPRASYACESFGRSTEDRRSSSVIASQSPVASS